MMVVVMMMVVMMMVVMVVPHLRNGAILSNLRLNGCCVCSKRSGLGGQPEQRTGDNAGREDVFLH
jgi:hypothetical protein